MTKSTFAHHVHVRLCGSVAGVGIALSHMRNRVSGEIFLRMRSVWLSEMRYRLSRSMSA